MAEVKIPRGMNTQHPDNVVQPFFSDKAVIEGDTGVGTGGTWPSSLLKPPT